MILSSWTGAGTNRRRRHWTTQWLRQNAMIEQNFWTLTFAKPASDSDWNRIMVSDVQTVSKAGQRSCLHTLHLLPCPTYLSRMGTGGATQAPDTQQYCGHLAGGGGIFLPLFMLKRLPKGFPQSGLSRNYMGPASSYAGAEAKGARRPVF